MVSKRSFVSVFSSLSIAGGVLAIAPTAFADCPAADPGALTAKPAKAISSACVQADIDALNAFVDNATASTTWAELEAAMTTQHAACAACAFSAQADATWGPLVKIGSGGGVMINYGACFERASGGSATCGATYQKAQLCASARCGSGSTCSTEAEQNTCLNTVFTDATSCGKYDIDTDCPNYDALTSEDPNNLGPCVDYIAMIATMCSAPGTVDAGPGPGPGVDAGPTPPKKDGGPTKKDASPTGDDDDDDDTTAGDDDDDDDDDSTSSKDAGKKASTNKASSDDDEDTGSASESGCAQSGSTSGSSVASALGLMFVVSSVLRARRRSKR